MPFGHGGLWAHHGTLLGRGRNTLQGGANNNSNSANEPTAKPPVTSPKVRRVAAPKPWERRRPYRPRRPRLVPPPGAGRSPFLPASLPPRPGPASSRLRCPCSPPPLTGSTCTSGPGVHAHRPATSAAHEPPRPPYRHRAEGETRPETRITGLQGKKTSPAEPATLSSSKTTLGAGRGAITCNFNHWFNDRPRT